jgi:hypothetical protein
MFWPALPTGVQHNVSGGEGVTPDWTPAPLSGRALLHMHCHSRAVLKAEADRSVLQSLGLDEGRYLDLVARPNRTHAVAAAEALAAAGVLLWVARNARA